MYQDLKKIENLNMQMRSVTNFKACSQSIKEMAKPRRQTLVLDIEDCLISKVEVQNGYELKELRKTANYS